MDRREEQLKSIWLAESLGAASRLGVALLRQFESVEEIYRQKPEDTADWSFLTKKEQGQMAQVLSRKKLDGAERILRQCEEKSIQVTFFRDPLYPASLRSLPTAPMVLYYKGSMPVLDRRFTVAVVGTRSMSDYGRQMAYRMGYGLTVGGGLIVSGMALGVDSVAMMGALDAGGTVVGVLGGGVDVIYPREHRQVYYRILDRGGCILSEYPPGTEPKGFHFPVRNRIISGLSDAGVVVEGDAKSGALITAKNLLYQGRKLFAVPGQIGLPGSEGPNALIRNGALPALEPEDILEEFVFLFPESIHMNAVKAAEMRIDPDAASRQTMQNTGVGIRSQSSYVGEGTYGGKSSSKKSPPRESTGRPSPGKPLPDRRKGGEPSEKQALPQSEKKTNMDLENVLFPKWMKDAAAHIMSNYADGRPFFTLDTPETEAEKPSKQRTPAPFPAETVAETKPEKMSAARSREVDTALLDESDMRIYNRMKPNVPVTPDELVNGSVTVAEVLTALTTLEMAGVVEAGSGGYFLRTDPDDFPISLVDENEIKDKE